MLDGNVDLAHIRPDMSEELLNGPVGHKINKHMGGSRGGGGRGVRTPLELPDY